MPHQIGHRAERKRDSAQPQERGAQARQRAAPRKGCTEMGWPLGL